MCKLGDNAITKTTVIPVKHSSDKVYELTKTAFIALVANLFITRILPELYSEHILLHSVYLTLLFVISREIKSLKGCVGIVIGVMISGFLIHVFDDNRSDESDEARFSSTNLAPMATMFFSTFGFLIGYAFEKIDLSQLAESSHALCMEFNNCMDMGHED